VLLLLYLLLYLLLCCSVRRWNLGATDLSSTSQRHLSVMWETLQWHPSMTNRRAVFWWLNFVRCLNYLFAARLCLELQEHSQTSSSVIRCFFVLSSWYKLKNKQSARMLNRLACTVRCSMVNLIREEADVVLPSDGLFYQLTAASFWCLIRWSGIQHVDSVFVQKFVAQSCRGGHQKHRLFHLMLRDSLHVSKEHLQRCAAIQSWKWNLPLCQKR